MNELSIKNVFNATWVKFKPVWGRLVLVFVAIFVVKIIVGILFDDKGFMKLIGGLISLFVTFVSAYVVPKVSLMVIGGEEINWSSVMSLDWKRVYFAGVLMIIATMIYAIGLLLLIIPGIIAMTRFCLGSLALVDEKLGPIEALKRSLLLTKGNALKIFYLGLVFTIGSLILGIVTFGIAFLVTSPFMILAMAHVYSVLKNNSMPVVEKAPQQVI